MKIGLELLNWRNCLLKIKSYLNSGYKNKLTFSNTDYIAVHSFRLQIGSSSIVLAVLILANTVWLPNVFICVPIKWIQVN